MQTDNERFSLKDHLFNVDKVRKIAREISAVYPNFKAKKFENDVCAKFPELELLERIYWIRDTLRAHLPDDYREAVKILLASMPEELDAHNTDDDFGDFIYAPYGYFVAEHGCTKKDLAFSLNALHEITRRFSAEAPIRFFINAFPEKTMAMLLTWTRDKNYHVRRLASEGTRPSLPWAKKVSIHYTDALPILDALYADTTRYVTRSVANHLNDISKIDPDAVLKLLKKWRKEKKQSEKELQFMTQHALRTLVKQGHKDALALLGYNTASIEVRKFAVHTSEVRVGEALEFSFEIVSTARATQQLMIDYIIHFNKANGALSPKTFKIAKKSIAPKERLHIEKRHSLRVMTTKKLYPGTHEVELQINGMSFGKKAFTLVSTDSA